MNAPTLLLQTQEGARPGQRIVRLDGRLSLETVSRFNENLRAESASAIILDMSGVSYLDSAGVGALVQLLVRFSKARQTLALASLSPKARAVLEVATVLNLFHTFPSVNEAVAQIS